MTAWLQIIQRGKASFVSWRLVLWLSLSVGEPVCGVAHSDSFTVTGALVRSGPLVRSGRLIAVWPLQLRGLFTRRQDCCLSVVFRDTQYWFSSSASSIQWEYYIKWSAILTVCVFKADKYWVNEWVSCTGILVKYQSVHRWMVDREGRYRRYSNKMCK